MHVGVPRRVLAVAADRAQLSHHARTHDLASRAGPRPFFSALVAMSGLKPGLKPYRSNAPATAVLYASATWCPHCRATTPEMEKAAAILGSVVPVYVVDSERNKDVVRALGVRGFPTIFFRNAMGRLVQYNGERRGQKIADWVCAHSGNCGRSTRH